MYTVMIIEDCRYTGSVLCEYLAEHQVERLTRDRAATEGVRTRHVPRDKHGTSYPTANNESGEGQLAQFRHMLYDYDRSFKCPDATLFPNDKASLEELKSIAGIKDRGERTEKLLQTLGAYGDIQRMVLVADLALVGDEGKRMERDGALKTSAASRSKMPDPRKTLRSLTGFQVMETLRNTMPVIVTTYSGSPLVAQHCLVNGAFAVVRKPAPEKSPDGFDMKTLMARSISEMENRAKRNKDLLDILGAHYGMTIVSEVLKAMGSITVSH